MTDHSENQGRGTTEVPEKARRRTFDQGFRLRIVEEADRCTEPGQIGALLRREGLYSSQLSNWRRQREEGTLSGRNSRKRGRKRKVQDPQEVELERLRREKAALAVRLWRAEAIIDVQKKVSDLLGIPPNRESDENSK